MGDVERIVDIDISVGVGFKIIEDMPLQRVRRFHYEGIEVKPPKPAFLSLMSFQSKFLTYHSALGYFLMQFRIVSTFSQLSLHSWA